MAQNVSTTVSFYTACLRSACAAYDEASEVSTDRNSLPVLERRPSEALDTAQLAFYLEFRRVPCRIVSDIGIYMCFQQYANSDPSARQEIHEQLVAEAAQTDMAGVLELYRFLLTGSHLEDFYEEVFRMLVLHVRALPRCVALADLVHHAQEQSASVTPILQLPLSMRGRRLMNETSFIVTSIGFWLGRSGACADRLLICCMSRHWTQQQTTTQYRKFWVQLSQKQMQCFRTVDRRRGLTVVLRTCLAKLDFIWIAGVGMLRLLSRPPAGFDYRRNSQRTSFSSHSRSESAPALVSRRRRCAGPKFRMHRCERDPRRPAYEQSRPGLKSRGGGSTSPSHFRRFLVTMLLQCNILPVIGVRVDSVPKALSGAQSGPQHLLRQANTAVPGCAKPSGSLDFSGPYLGAVRKRAYKRACDRASLRGGTYYRGRWHTACSLQATRVQPQQAPHIGTASRTHRAGTGNRQPLSRLHVLTWNAGGLSLAMFELILLLDTSEYAHVSAVIIQETHWKRESTCRASGWSCVHSGCESESYTGILIMVRGKLVPHDLIRYDVVKPGRLLHVRIPFGPQLQDRSLDILGIYQYPWDARKPRAQLLEARAGIWKQLDVVLRRLPRRNLLFVCGDLNVQLPAQDRHVGTGIVLRNPGAQQATDSSAMLQVVVSHDLCAINTWRGPKQQAFTYSMGAARTLIDYIFVRASDADRTAKGCLPLTAFPVAAWRLDGRHRAIIGSISTRWSVRTSSRRVPCFDQEALLTGTRPCRR